MNKKENNIILNFFNDVGEYIKLHYPVILLVIVGYILFSIINFFNMTLSQTVFSYHIEDFEVGQIADQTIFAPKDFLSLLKVMQNFRKWQNRLITLITDLFLIQSFSFL